MMTDSPQIIEAAEAMRLKRAELIEKPLDRIWRDLALAGIQAAAKYKRCPWGKGMPDPDLQPTDPCPVCGDLGTFDSAREPSKCVE